MILIAGPCVIESKEICDYICGKTLEIISNVEKKNNTKIDFYFKGSIRKANRTRLDSFTGIGFQPALDVLAFIKDKYKVPVVTDVHEVHEIEPISRVCNVVQIPAFLCRQTDLLIEAGKKASKINIKKGQFMSPESMEFAFQKVVESGAKKENIMLTERGTTFGYGDLVVDMRSFPVMKKYCSNVIIDCTHSNQKPNQSEGVTGGDPDRISTIAFSAIAAGADGMFIETHHKPKESKSDSSTILNLDYLESILDKAVKLQQLINK